MIQRLIYNQLVANLSNPKILLLYGPRQVGKTTVLKRLSKETDKRILWWNGDEPDIRADLKQATSSFLKNQLSNYDVLIIDEAQRIENIGLTSKLIYENIPEIKVIASGSSSFDLGNKINEPLTGRKQEFQLFPISAKELVNQDGERELNRLLKTRLIFGSYPEVIMNPGNEREIVLSLADSYLYKDILTWENIQKPAKLEKLIQALAFQLGSEVSINELSQLTGLDNHTVERYIQLLEKSFVIFQLHAFSRNLRNELKKSRKIYFYDNGIRNAVINQFAPFELRQDMGALWENYLVSERMKKMSYNREYVKNYFWRTFAGQEIDFIEEVDGKISAFEFKWNPKAKPKFSKSFTNEYSPEITQVVNLENYSDFIL
ncbi:MAG: ATP-binding protein [Bacteroidetes bacterium]|nr:ATP-binding protein [Bacteroidota bacterium]